jgi:hypothetical protein
MRRSASPFASPVRRRQLLLIALIMGVAAEGSAQTSALQQAAPVFRAEASLVPVDVRVVDKNGRPITDLTQADFSVFENGVRQEISQFLAQTYDYGADLIGSANFNVRK